MAKTGNHSKTRRGIRPNPKRTPKAGTGRNRPARGFNPLTKEWSQK